MLLANLNPNWCFSVRAVQYRLQKDLSKEKQRENPNSRFNREFKGMRVIVLHGSAALDPSVTCLWIDVVYWFLYSKNGCGHAPSMLRTGRLPSD